jgi:hypothetical protein
MKRRDFLVDAVLAEWCNGGKWSTHYTDAQKEVWRLRALSLRKNPEKANPT